ncbi:MAG: Gfo/Idh/MocA family protein [Candidatus Marivariicella sp.]
MKRKNFIKKSALLASSGFLFPRFSSLAKAGSILGSNETINIGTIGLNSMGWWNTKSLLRIPEVNLIAICDVDARVIEKRKAEMDKQGVKVKTFRDYRKLLEDKDIDAVVIGTPDHWHALMMIHASEAGKHVYCEKPIGNSIGECRLMVDAQNRYGNVVQVGQWQRSQNHFQEAVNYLKTGVIGPIRTVKTWCYFGSVRPNPIIPNSSAPKELDYKRWLGPAKIRPFNKSRLHFNFRWFWDYAGGLMTDWGVHLIDFALIGMQASLPKTVVSLGGKFAYPNLAQETPDTLTALYEFDQFNLIWDSAMGIDNGPYGRRHGIAFIGDYATLILNRNGWEVIEESGNEKKVAKPLVKSSDNGLDKHTQNFIEAIRSNDPLKVKCTIKEGEHVATIAQMGNISYRSGEKLQWDFSKNKFSDNKINSKYFTSEYHNGYKLNLT